jgi:hypothetical protein
MSPSCLFEVLAAECRSVSNSRMAGLGRPPATRGRRHEAARSCDLRGCHRCLPYGLREFAGANRRAPGPVAVSATRTGPAPIDYNNPSDLEAALRVQWTREMGDPKNAHYAPGVKVKSILCSRDVQPHTLRCRITPTRGEPKTNLYLASDDGHSFTGVGPGDS